MNPLVKHVECCRIFDSHCSIMKYRDKAHFIEMSERSWQELWGQIDAMSESQQVRRRRLAKSSKSESVKDVLAHLYGWHRLALQWYRDGLEGMPDLPCKEFNWRQTPDINARIFKAHRDAPLVSVRRKLKLSHRAMMKIVESLREAQLMNSGEFAWTGKLSLASYFGPNLTSHYRWASKRVKAIGKA